MADAEIIGETVIVNDEKLSNSLHSKGFIGNLSKARLELSGVEAMYLLEKKKITIEKIADDNSFAKIFQKKDKRFMIKFNVFRDLRDKGYVVKTALKYGFDFRVYDKGINPGEKHAKWLVNCTNQDSSFSVNDFSKLIRIGHSVRKSVLIAVFDTEGDITYWESNWSKM
jgi:tRNA-intron endonuclease